MQGGFVHLPLLGSWRMNDAGCKIGQPLTRNPAARDGNLAKFAEVHEGSQPISRR